MCVVIKSLVKRSWLSLSLLVYCVRAERGSRRLSLSHIHPDRLSDKKRVRWLLLHRMRRARCAANKKSPTQTILAGIHCDAKRTKAAAWCLFSVCFLWVHRRANFWSQTKLAAHSLFSLLPEALQRRSCKCGGVSFQWSPPITCGLFFGEHSKLFCNYYIARQ